MSGGSGGFGVAAAGRVNCLETAYIVLQRVLLAGNQYCNLRDRCYESSRLRGEHRIRRGERGSEVEKRELIEPRVDW